MKSVNKNGLLLETHFNFILVSMDTFVALKVFTIAYIFNIIENTIDVNNS